MRSLLIASIALALSWLPTAATAIPSLIHYDLEFEATVWSPDWVDYNFDSGALTKTYNGTVLAYFDGQTTMGCACIPFSLPLSSVLDVDGTMFYGNGEMDFWVSVTNIHMDFDGGRLSGSTDDEIYVDNDYDEHGNQLTRLTLPMDVNYMFSGGLNRAAVFFEAMEIDYDTTNAYLVEYNIQLTNGREIFSVPEPSIIWLFGSGLIGLIGIARRKKS